MISGVDSLVVGPVCEGAYQWLSCDGGLVIQVVIPSVVDQNSLNSGFWPNLAPDPGLHMMYVINFEESFGG